MHVKPTEPSVAAPIGHYENFPVASWLCPPPLRPPIAALYHFARTADDLADEGDVSAPQRLLDLAAYQADLDAIVAGRPHSARWAAVFAPLAHALNTHALPPPLLYDLLSAFGQDVVYTRDARRYPTRDALLDYCRRSANPVGRLLLHLYGVHQPTALAQSDAICTALQLINFWQDVSQDVPRCRHYLPQADCDRYGVTLPQIESLQTTPQSLALMRELIDWAEQLMHTGAPLVHRLPGRAGWELRLVVQGGLRILTRLRHVGCDSFQHRPKLGKRDLIPLLWGALRM